MVQILLHGQNYQVSHSISIHGLTQIRNVGLNWFKRRSPRHVLKLTEGIRLGDMKVCQIALIVIFQVQESSRYGALQWNLY